MTNLERLKEAMKTETTIGAIARSANVPKSMVLFHVGTPLPKKRVIKEKS